MKAGIKIFCLSIAWVATVLMAYSLGAYPAWAESRGLKRYDPNRPDHRQEMLRLIYVAQPALREIQAFVQKNLRPPKENEFDRLTGLSPAYRESCLDSRFGWRYSSSDSTFILYYKLNWDASLNYHSQDSDWTFDPGDGSPETRLHP